MRKMMQPLKLLWLKLHLRMHRLDNKTPMKHSKRAKRIRMRLRKRTTKLRWKKNKIRWSWRLSRKQRFWKGVPRLPQTRSATLAVL